MTHKEKSQTGKIIRTEKFYRRNFEHIISAKNNVEMAAVVFGTILDSSRLTRDDRKSPQSASCVYFQRKVNSKISTHF